MFGSWFFEHLVFMNSRVFVKLLSTHLLCLHVSHFEAREKGNFHIKW